MQIARNVAAAMLVAEAGSLVEVEAAIQNIAAAGNPSCTHATQAGESLRSTNKNLKFEFHQKKCGAEPNN